jgi:hypothetical protein
MNKETENEMTIEDLGKTFPWEGIFACILTGYPLFEGLYTKEIDIENTRFEGTEIIHQVDRPTEYWVVFSVIAFCFLLSFFYTVARYVHRMRLLKQSTENND